MINEWIEIIDKFKKHCISLPKDLKTWKAYNDLKGMVENHKLVLPIIAELKKPSIEERHWISVCEITGDDIPYA